MWSEGTVAMDSAEQITQSPISAQPDAFPVAWDSPGAALALRVFDREYGPELLGRPDSDLGAAILCAGAGADKAADASVLRSADVTARKIGRARAADVVCLFPS